MAGENVCRASEQRNVRLKANVFIPIDPWVMSLQNRISDFPQKRSVFKIFFFWGGDNGCTARRAYLSWQISNAGMTTKIFLK